MDDPLAGLPRVTYASASADFSGLHAVFDRAFPGFVGAALGGSHANLIGGRPDDSGRRYAVASPVDASIELGALHAADADAIDRAVAAARAAHPDWRAAGWAGRVAALRRCAEAMRATRLELAMALVLEVGKSRIEAMGEVEESIDLIGYYCDHVEDAQGWEQALGSATPSETGSDRLRPYGTFAVISPFNYPIALSVGMTTAALLGGNCVVFKPSPGAVLSAPALARIWMAGGLPDGAFNLVCGERDTGEALVTHPGIDGIAFTGSHEAGMAILRQVAAGRHARPVLAELGGKNAAFVTASADLQAAASGVARSAFGMSGQKCSSCSKVYVHRAVRDAFIERLLAFSDALVVDNPMRAGTFTGPVIDRRAARRFDDALASVRAAGGRLLAGGGRVGGEGLDRGAYLQPTIVDGLAPDHEANRRELFLPLLSVQVFDALDDAIADANRSAFGLTSGIYSRDEAELARYDDRIEAGVLYVNRPGGATTGAWPGFQTFCGWKGSGTTGKGGLGPHYVQQFMREQSRTVGRASGTIG
jgi:1-pyrroline-5-carboxylate dehydrogenase